MTHDELVERAERWLRNTIGCGVVLTEASGAYPEIPDAIGWKGNSSYLVECKTSKSDFKRDQKKWFRRTDDFGLGLGKYRYYMTSKDLLNPDDLPEGWGLLEINGKRVKKKKEAKRRNFAKGTRVFEQELGIMYSELRKIQLLQRGRGFIKPTCYDKKEKKHVPVRDYTKAEKRLLTIFMEQDGSGI